MKRIGLNSRVLITLLLVGAFAIGLQAQTPNDRIREVLIEKATFQPSDLKELDEGKIVVKAIPTNDKQIVSVFGAVRLKDISAVPMEEFRASLTQRSNRAMKGGGRFSVPPAADDLQGLELEDKDYKVLKKCSVGDCDMNMSAEMIRRLGAEVDWNAADHKERATVLFREMLLQYVRGYTSNGDGTLGQYANRREIVDLADAHRSLLASSLMIKDISPEIYGYFGEFPKKQVARAESEMHWSTVDFGLKPAITITHTVAFDVSQNGLSRFIVANKQIYASRYLDASLSFTMLISSGVNDPGGYLIFTDRSRSDALDGMMSGIARSVVEKEAVEKVRGMLQNAELRMLAAGRPKSDQPNAEISGYSRINEIMSDPIFITAVVGVLGIAVLLILRQRKA